MKKYLTASIVSLISLALFSVTAYAQVGAADVNAGIGTIETLITNFNQRIVRAVGVLFLSSGVVIFFLGIVQYVWGLRSGDPGKTKTGNTFMLWGLIALFVMFSVYGIITFAQSTLFPGRDMTSITIPNININGGTRTTTGSNPLSPSQATLSTCPDGVTTYDPSVGTGLCPGPSMCPDGVTPYYNNDASLCPRAGTTCPTGMVFSVSSQACITAVGGGR